ncbi:MAG: hypothetical protein GEU98_12755 [Pseudonocardiaceae bacterium]|nr:hypothetical protein [Pseudonocardiaceae bacterium]
MVVATRIAMPRPVRYRGSVNAAEAFRAYNDAVNRQDRAMARAWVSPDLTATVNGCPVTDIAYVDPVMDRTLLRCYPDCHREILRTLVEGDQAAVRWRTRGTPAEDRASLPPLDVHGCVFARVRGGRIVNVAIYYEDVGLQAVLTRARQSCGVPAHHR